MVQERAMGTYWMLAVTLVLGLGLALGLTTMVSAGERAVLNAVEPAPRTEAATQTTAAVSTENVRQPQSLVPDAGPTLQAGLAPQAWSPVEGAPAPQALAGVPGASDEWWAGVQARLHRESQNLSLATAPDWTATGENDGDRFGVSVASAGDVNSDGYADAIVGAFLYPGGGIQGRAYVYHGSELGLEATPALTLTGENNNERFGLSVA